MPIFATQAALEHGPASRHDAAGIAPSRALVPIRSAGSVEAGSCRHADLRATAPFLTHLLATAQGLPQTRARCRAEPTRVITAYADRIYAPPMAGGAVHESR